METCTITDRVLQTWFGMIRRKDVNTRLRHAVKTRMVGPAGTKEAQAAVDVLIPAAGFQTEIINPVKVSLRAILLGLFWNPRTLLNKKI